MKRKLLKILIIGCLSLPIVLIAIVLGFFSTFQLRGVSFTLEKDAVRIPLIIERERYYTYVVVENDTIRMLIDTGATGSFFSYESATRTLRRGLNIDAGGFWRLLPIRRINKMQWGGVKIENLLVRGSHSNIIGDDILRHFIVQFDNYNREIVLTQNPSLIEKGGVRVPFSRGWGDRSVIISLSLNEQEGNFIFDTGYVGELRVDSVFFNSSGLSDLENIKWKGLLGGSSFMPDSLWKEGATYMTIARHELGGMVFDNAIVARCMHWHTNVVGFVFMQRFRTFTIDYINGYIYFELPKDKPPAVSFSNNLSESVPFAYLQLLYRRINSLGIEFSRRRFDIISALVDDDVFAKIEIGDTLVGINQTMFNETAFNKLGSNQNLFHLEADRSQQVAAVSEVFHRRNKATFHFLKNGKLISIDRERARILCPPPRLGYSFIGRGDGTYSVVFSVGYFFMISSPDPNSRMMMFHPWSTLSGEDFQISVFNDGVETIVSNDPDTYNPFAHNWR